jgi:hypothetical protein
MSTFDDRVAEIDALLLANTIALNEMLTSQAKRMRALNGEVPAAKTPVAAAPQGVDTSVIGTSPEANKAAMSEILNVLQPNRAGSAGLDAARKKANAAFHIESIGKDMTKEDVTLAASSILSVLREQGFKG